MTKDLKKELLVARLQNRKLKKSKKTNAKKPTYLKSGTF